MRPNQTLSIVILVLAAASPRPHAEELCEPIDLSAADRLEAADAAAAGTPDWIPVGMADPGSGEPPARLYVSGIVGASFATLTTGGSIRLGPGPVFSRDGSVNETIFTGGGALGVAFARPSGQLRMEIEGRARGPMGGSQENVTDDWSTLTNFWRDVSLTDSMGVYAGGGFGVGGYRYTYEPGIGVSAMNDVTTFAWQAGAGFIYELNDRVTIDTGYRFFAMSPGSFGLRLGSAQFLPIGLGEFTSAFSASELLLSIRIYEPFRNWR